VNVFYSFTHIYNIYDISLIIYGYTNIKNILHKSTVFVNQNNVLFSLQRFIYDYKQSTIEMIYPKHLLHINYKWIKEGGPVSFFYNWIPIGTIIKNLNLLFLISYTNWRYCVIYGQVSREIKINPT